MNKSIISEFSSRPGSAYRGKPFWALNGKLDPEELRRQIRVMNRMGLGGFFMHSRVGLATPYLADEWFECVDACVDEANKLNMEAWLYDEDRWPSGAAGGLVTKDPKYRRRFLRMNMLRSPAKLKWTKDTLAVFTAKVNGCNATDVKRLKRGNSPRNLGKNFSFIVFNVETEQPSSWYNGYTYLDTMSRDAVKKFIQVTHQAYGKRYKKHFGKAIPGIFTDEPNLGCFTSETPSTGMASWTPTLPAVFKRRYGYDLIPHLPELFFDVDGKTVTPARYHYHDCRTHLFVDAFARQIGEWCEKNGIQHTGHVLYEQDLTYQASSVGSAMRFYEHMQAPGMDILTEHWREYDTAKQVSSAARQFDRKWRLTETYGCTGWDFPFVGHKAIGDWQAALGINLRCPHLSWYTMEGEAKRDYPASIFYQSPWWELYPKVEDYFARLNLMTTQGAEVRDVLVIHPIESIWVLFNKDRHSAELTKQNNSIIAVRDSLLAANIDFDYGDEEIMARHGKVSRKQGAPTLKVAKAAYKAVIVPPLKTMRSSTLKLLKTFKAAGGTVVFAGELPEYVDAKPSSAVVEFASKCRKTPDRGKAIPKSVESVGRRVSITDASGKEILPALHLLREDKDCFYLFVCNTGHKPSQLKTDQHDPSFVRDRNADFPAVKIRGFAECTGQPLEFDLETGKIFAARAGRSGKGWEIKTGLAPSGSRLFVIPKKKGAGKYPAQKQLSVKAERKLGGARWDVNLSEANNLVLDRPAYRIGATPWQKPAEILWIDRQVRSAMGIPKRGGAMAQPWTRKKATDPKRIQVDLKYGFEIKNVPSGDLFLCIEQPVTFDITVNGTPINTDAESGWWCDMSLRRLPIDPNVLRKGRNEIMLVCDYTEDHPGLEIMYLRGNFGTKVQGNKLAITAAPTSLKLGDWCRQGLDFYAGNVSYCRTITPKLRGKQRLFVRVPEYRGAAVRVLVDGKEAGIIAWEPNEVDVTPLVNGDPVRLQIEVVGHCRNSHGPHHHRQKWPTWTGPGEYQVESGSPDWYEGYQLVPCGLMADPELIVRK